MDKYKLVPVIPTEEMLEAGHYAMVDGYHPGGIYADMLAAAPSAHGPLSLSDEKILEIASNPMSTPCSPWWLKGDVKAGDVQNAAIAFAKAVLKAATPVMQGEPVAWRNIKEEKPEDGQDCITKMKHGIIQGTYCSEDDTFSGYYWREMGWYATHWVPAEEAIYTAPQPAVQGECLGEGKCTDQGCPAHYATAAPQPPEQVENWRHDSEDLEALHHNLDDAGVPRCDSAGTEYSAWGRVIQYAKAAAYHNQG